MNLFKRCHHCIFIFVFVVTLLSLDYLCSAAYAQQNTGYRATVQLKIDAGSKLKPRLESYLQRELASLGYVSTATNNPDWQLSLVADTFTGSGNDDEIVIISVLVSKPFENELFSFLVNEEYKDIFLSSSENLHELKSQILYTGTLRELQLISKRIITEFSAAFLERERTEFNITNQNLKRLKDK